MSPFTYLNLFWVALSVSETISFSSILHRCDCVLASGSVQTTLDLFSRKVSIGSISVAIKSASITASVVNEENIQNVQLGNTIY